MAVRIITTGGTFDKEYNEITGSCFSTEATSRRFSREAGAG